MARNSKRNAFTIVELVIVIAVIAILSTVLITTFTGVIESANVSADKQLLSTLNTQLSMHIGKGNDIDTVDDLKTALNQGDIKYWEKLDPKSAQYGYHYWYNPVKQEIVLSTYEKLENLNVKAEPIGRFLGEVSFAPKARASEGFEAASPRTLDNGYYFLDQKGKNDNKISDFFFDIENMSLGNDYTAALSKLNLSANDKNKELADEILKKISATAIVTNKGVFINAATTEQVIKNIYIPENLTGNADYYLNNKVVNAGAATVKDLAELTVTVSNITIPANIKVAEGSLTGFVNVTINVNVASGTELKNIFSANSVSADATIVTNNGDSYTIDGAEVKKGTDKVDTLEYRNPVASFEIITGESNIIWGGVNGENYIALDKIYNGIVLNFDANAFVGEHDEEGKPGTPAAGYPNAYEKVTWELKEAVAGVSIHKDTGAVTFDNTFKADSFTVKVKAVSSAVSYEFTVYVAKLTYANIKFNTTGSSAVSATLVNGAINDKFMVNYLDGTTASFDDLSDFVYTANGKNITSETVDFDKLGCTTPTFALKAGTENNYFTVDGKKLGLSKDNIGALKGRVDTQTVTITVSDKAGVAFATTATVTINDTTGTPYTPKLPTYTKVVDDPSTPEIDTYVYKVGNGSKIPLSVFFKENTTASTTANMGNYKILVCEDEATEGVYQPTKTIIPENWDTFEFDFSDAATYEVGTKYYIVIAATVTDDDGEVLIKDKQLATVRFELVKGTNITEDSATLEAKGQVTYTDGVVLHNNITFEGESDRALIVLGANAKLYGNYFTITAKNFKDTDSTTASPSGGDANSGYSLITMSGNASEINNLILDGPVYPEIATGSSKNGYYTFGINIVGNNCVINDSYLFGFASPVRIQAANIETTINDTVLEGGTWSNLWISSAKTVTLNNVTTIQDHTKGYAPTLGTDAQKKTAVLGMGIYIHDDLAARADDRKSDPKDDTIELTLNLIGDTKQYNWISESAMGFGGNIEFAQKLVFDKNNGDYIYAEMLHYDKDGKAYANAAVAYQCVDMAKTQRKSLFGGYKDLDDTIWNLIGGKPAAVKKPNIKTNVDGSINYSTKDIISVEVPGSDAESLKSVIEEQMGEVIASIGLSIVKVTVDVFVSSPAHTGDDCGACYESTVPNVYETFCTSIGDGFMTRKTN